LKSLSPVTIKAALTTSKTSSHAANFRRVAAELGRFARFCCLRASCRGRKSKLLEAVAPDGGAGRERASGIRLAKEILSGGGRACLSPQPPGASGKFQQDEALEQDARVVHGSNINSASKSCGKLKAMPFAQIFVAATAGFFAAGK
jgi:hypothetical protein